MLPSKRRVYLAGAIFQQGDEQVSGWRKEAARLLGSDYTVIDPARRDYRGRELENQASIVRGDLMDIDSCGVVLVNASLPSWGTAMEVFYAAEQRRHLVVAFTGGSPVSPWLAFHANFVGHRLIDAVAFIRLGQD